MTRHFKTLIAAAALASVAVTAMPAIAQDAPEEARTTYQLTYLKFAPNAAERWTEMMDKYYAPANAAAGLPATQVHWLMDGEWDILLVRPMPRGMATIDAHTGPERKSYEAAFARTVGGEAAAKALNEENEKLIAGSMRLYSHTHP